MNPFPNDAFYDDDNNTNNQSSKFESFLQRPTNSSRSDISDGMSYVSRMKHDNYAHVVQEMKTKQVGSGGGGDCGVVADHQGQGRVRQGVRQQQQRGSPHWPQQQQQQQQFSMQQQESGFDMAFDDSSRYFTRQQQSHEQQQQRPQPPSNNNRQSTTSSRRRTPPRANNNPNNNNSSPTTEVKKPQTRMGRKLYQDPNDDRATRSRSTVKRTADRTAQLALMAHNHNMQQQQWQQSQGQSQHLYNDNDGLSDVGSAISSAVGGGYGGGDNVGGHPNDYQWSGSGSVGGDGFGGFPSRQQQHSRAHQWRAHRQSPQQSNSRTSLDSRSSLDSFVARNGTSSNDNTSSNNNNNNDDNCSVVSGVSGANGVAARRRLKRQQQVSHASTDGSGTPRAIPPPHRSPAASASSPAGSSSGLSARNRMRMRMQASSPRTPGNATAATSSIADSPLYSPGAKKLPMHHQQQQQQQQQSQQRLSPPRQKRNNQPPPFNNNNNNNADFDLSTETIDQEVNLALSELKLLDLDLAQMGEFGRTESGGSTVGSRGGSGTITMGNSGSLSIDSSTVRSGQSFANNNAGMSGFPKSEGANTASTFNDKLKNSHNNNNNSGGGNGGGGNTSPHTVSTKSLTIDNGVNSASIAISPLISVEQYSESSSLTDDNHYNPGAGGGGGGWKPNMFKDAELGSTFHKSKKIVRPGEDGGGGGSSIPEGKSVAMATTTAASKALSANAGAPTSSSVRNRISQFKNVNASPSPTAATCVTPRQSGASSKCQQRQQRRNVVEESTFAAAASSPANSVSSVKNSPFRRKDRIPASSPSAGATSSWSPAACSNRLPPTTPTTASNNTLVSSDNVGGNPFTVKLRKTKPPVSPLLPPKKETIHVVTTAATTPSSTSSTTSYKNRQSESSHRVMHHDRQSVESNNESPLHSNRNRRDNREDEPKNQFLAQVKLRKTPGSTTSSAVAPPKKEIVEQRIVMEESVNNRVLLAEEVPKTKKLTYREQQELLKAQKQQLEQQQQMHHEVLEEAPKKKLTYREQQELLKQQQQGEQQQQQPGEEPPATDVATLIRERIAASKQSSLARLSTTATAGSDGGSDSGGGANLNALRGNLKKTSNAVPSPVAVSDKAPSSKVHTAERTTASSTNAKSALNAMLQNKHGNIVGQGNAADAAVVNNGVQAEVAAVELLSFNEEEDEMEDVDPRASLMAMLGRRGGGSTPRAAPAPVKPAASSAPSPRLAPQNEDNGNPRNALMAMIAKRGDNNGDERANEKNALSAMLAKRGGAPPVAAAVKKRGVAPSQQKNGDLSAMLANRAAPQAQASGGDGRPALKHDPKYEKYFKMLKVGMPLPAVQHAMTRDGLDSTVMDGNHNLPVSIPKPQGISGGDVPLKNDPTYIKYFKMLNMGLPMGAVKNAMGRDGLDPSVMDGDHNAPLPSSSFDNGPSTGGAGNSSSAKKKEKDTHRRTRLHWDTLEVDNKSKGVNPNSVWALLEADADELQIQIDEKEFTTLFQAEIKSTIAGGTNGGRPGGGGGGNGGSGSKNVVQVIDPKRANNGGIILARLRMSYDDLAKAVERIDETAMTANQAQGIIEYMPTLPERKSLRDYMKASKNGESVQKFERLCECEKFMVAMMTVKQSKRKIRALLFKLQFRGCIHDLAHDVFSIENACDELSNSVRLRKLFGIVLNIGNRLNTAGPGQKRNAGAFTIKSLLKLNQAKAFDNKTTFLHYVVLVVQRNSEALLDFKDDIPTVSKAGKIYWDQCVSELEEVETQLENVRKLALHEAKSNKIMYSLPNKSKTGDSAADNDSDDLSVETMSLEDEVALLRSTKVGMFALSAIRKVSQLRERVDTAKDKFSSLLEYFGESGDSKMQPHQLFEIIITFCRTFDVARADVEKKEKAKKRDEKRDSKDHESGSKNEKLKAIQENQTPLKKKNTPPLKNTPPPRSLPRASSHQPNMGNIFADLKRATSAKLASPSASASPAGRGPPKVTHGYPSDEKLEKTPSHNATPHQIQRRQPAAPSPQSSESEACARANAAEEVDARVVLAQQQAEALEAARLAKQMQEQVRAKANAAEVAQARVARAQQQAEALDAARLAKQIQEQRLAEEESARIVMQEKRLAKEAAVAEEAARIAFEQKQRAEAEAIAASSYKSEADGPTGRGSKKPTPDPNNQSNSPMTRREIMASRRERARNRHTRQTSSPTKPKPLTVATPVPPTPPAAIIQTPAPRKDEPKQEVEVCKPSPASSASSRASARDRYARHKKMLQHRSH